MSTTDPTLPTCAHCGHQDTDEIGDHDSVVARCSTCDVLTCGTCWDELHAETCSEPEPTAPYRAGLVMVHPQTCECPLCYRPKPPNPWPATPKMSRAHFAYLARILAELHFLSDEGLPHGGAGTTLRYVAEHFAYHLADTNGHFDRDRFVEAATK